VSNPLSTLEEANSAHLLLVQQDEGERPALSAILVDLGCEITAVADAQAALYLLESQVFDLILLVADSEGAASVYHLLRELQATGLTAAVPVVVLATAADVALVEQCLRLGAEDYLLPPWSPALLRTRIQRCLEKKRLREVALSERAASSAAEKLADDLRYIILPFGVALSAEKDFDRLLEKVVLEAQAICQADSGVLFLRSGDDRLRFVTARLDSLDLALGGTTGRPVPYPPLSLPDPLPGANHNLHRYDPAVHAAVYGKAINVADVHESTAYDFSGIDRFDAEHGYHAISLLIVPLKDHENSVVGVLQLMNARDAGSGQIVPFDTYHQLVVESLASQAAVVLNNQMLRLRQHALLKMERDLQIGRQIQSSFLPVQLPQPDGWEICGRFHPAHEVAGDFYDAFLMSHGRVGFLLADVCGKGVGAALFMALTRSLIRAFVQQEYYLPPFRRPGDGGRYAVLESLAKQTTADERLLADSRDTLLNGMAFINNYIFHNHGDAAIFATLFFGVLDPATGVVTYVNAGHSPPLVAGAAGVKAYLVPTGPALGLQPDTVFAAAQVTLQRGDLLLAYTDGVTEARSDDSTLFGRPRLVSLVEQMPATANALLDRIEVATRHHMGSALQADDMALLALRRLGPLVRR
jgi:phosphoserine phosphatase RsbU/P